MGTSVDIIDEASGEKVEVVPLAVCGVAIEGFLKEDIVNSTPPEVKALMESKECMDLYRQLVESVGKTVKHRLSGSYKTGNIQELIDDLGPKFERAGIKVFVCRKVDIKEQYGVTHKWFEFVDTCVAPAYEPAERYEKRKVAG